MTFGHAAIGIAAARGYERSASFRAFLLRALVLGCLALLPDIDFLFFPGQHDALTPFAHRGLTHSSITAIVVALVVGLVAKASTTSRARRVFVVVALVLASHGICDSLGTRGRGVALLWPATSTRFIHHLLAPAPFPPRPWTLGFWPLAAYELAFSLPFVVFSLVRQHPKQKRNRLSKPGD